MAGDGKPKLNIIGSVGIIVFHNVLGGFAPATAAAPLAISVQNQFIMDLWQ